jgi:tRNA(Ile)-lysidine synthase
VRALAQARQIGIEAAARLARYEFLASVADTCGASRIAVAHNADDQVETVLFHLLRGAGLTGLGGMAYVASLSGRPDLTLIRPLLDVPRADLNVYCSNHNLHPRHDASNEDVSYTRNRLRHQVIPYLRDVSPKIERNLRQLADIAHVEDDFADFALHQAIDPHITQTDGRIRLPRAIFKEMHSALQRRFVLWAAHSIATAEDVGYVHVAAAVELALRGEVGAVAQLTGGIQLRLDYAQVIVERENLPVTTDRPLLPPQVLIPVVIPGVTRIEPAWSLETSLAPFEFKSVKLAVPEGGVVVLRGRREGDHIASLGLHGHHHKVSKWMINWQIPRDLRERVPLLVIDGEIAVIWWTPMPIISEQFVVKTDSPRVVYLRLTRNLLL